MFSKRKLNQAENFLIQSDKKLANLIYMYGPCQLSKDKRSDLFTNLISIIINQQLSNKAAGQIKTRFFNLIGKKNIPQSIISYNPSELRSCGLSYSKIDFIQGLSGKILSGDLNLLKLKKMSDDEIIKYLVKFKGIGKWTAEMFLIFSLNRPDVFSLTDSALTRAIQNTYSINAVNKDEIITLSNTWKPYRSTASWYLWRTLD